MYGAKAGWGGCGVGRKPPLDCGSSGDSPLERSRFNYRQVVAFQVTYFPDGFPGFSFLTQSFDILEPGRKKSHYVTKEVGDSDSAIQDREEEEILST